MPIILSDVPLPVADRIALPRRPDTRKGEPDPQEGLVGDTWREYFTALSTTVSQNPQRVNSEQLTAQSAAISATDLTNGVISAGLYRLSYYARITQPAGVSSSLTVTLSWTDGGVPQSQAFAAMTGNATTTFQTGTILLKSDANAPIRYATAYASVGAPVMEYALSVSLEQLSV